MSLLAATDKGYWALVLDLLEISLRRGGIPGDVRLQPETDSPAAVLKTAFAKVRRRDNRHVVASGRDPENSAALRIQEHRIR